MRLRRLICSLAVLAGATASTAVWASSSSAAEPDVCSSMTAPAFERLNPITGAQLVTAWKSEADGAASRYGFSEDHGARVAVSTTAGDGLVAVHRLYQPISRDFVYVTSETELEAAVRVFGYRDHGPVFYAASTSQGDCATPVLRFQRGALHRLAAADQRDEFEAAGWRYETVAFFATVLTDQPPPPPPATTTAPPVTTTSTTTAPPTTAPPSGDTTFSFAVIPDTQNETYSSEQRMQRRVSWLLDQRDELDLRWVLHSGDVHNWDTPDHGQFVSMSAWLQPLNNAGLPLVLTVGNHDTDAVCPGGSACPGANANLALRDTSTWNSFYSPQRFGFEGVFEAGKSDNGWRTIEAGGKQWMLLSLELWPRTEVIQWARSVIASHPDHNVIVVTHAFLEGNGQVSGSNGGYGANSPATLWAALDDYANVQMIFSGHVGVAANTTLTAADGHPVLAYLQSFHDASRNPTRIVTVDAATGTISTSIVANFDKFTGSTALYEYTAYRATFQNLRLVS